MNKSESPESNLFSEFTKIFAGLLIGLASFQLLAPLIWNYLSDLMHLEKITSYRVIISVYFLLPGFLVIIWWYNSGKKIGQLFILNSPGDSLKASQGLIKLTGIFFVLLLVVNFFLLHFSESLDDAKLFYSIQVIGTIICAYILFRVVYYIERVLKKQKPQKRKRYYIFTILICLLFIFYVVFELIYLSHRDKTKTGDLTTFDRLKIPNKAVICNAFRSIELKDALLQARKKFEINQEQEQLMQKVALVNQFNNPDDALNVPGTALFYLFEDTLAPEKHLENDKKNEPHHLEEMSFYSVQKNLVVLNHLINWAADSIAKNSSTIVFEQPPFPVASMLGYAPIEHREQTDLISLDKELQWYGGTIEILKMLENKMSTLSKRQLTLVLGNTQMKGIFLFSFFLIIMLGFYLLLKINEDILNSGIPGDTVSTENAELNKKLLSSVWLIINVGVWLLIPLFKPVSESTINIDRPLQSMTFTRYLPQEKTVTTMVAKPVAASDNQAPIIINHYELPSGKDSVIIMNADTSMSDEILKRVLQRMDKLNTSDEEAKSLFKLYKAVKSSRSPAEYKWSDFKPN